MSKSVMICLGMLILSLIVSGCPEIACYLHQQALFDGGKYKIAYVCLTDDYWQLWTMNSDGSSQNQITKTQYDKRHPEWISDKEIVFLTNNHKVFVTDLSGNERQILKGVNQVGGFAHSPNGNKLVFVRIKDHSRDKYNLWTAKTDGSNARMITHSSGRQYDPAWSAEGDKIAYIQYDGYRLESLCLIEKEDDSNITKLTDGKSFVFQPAFSPDGRNISYVSDVSGDYEIWLTDITTGDAAKVTSSRGIDTSPSWTPDGQGICFMSNRTGTPQIYMMNSDGTDLRQLTGGNPAMDPACRKDSIDE